MGAIYEPFSPNQIKDKWIEVQMKKREAEFVEYQKLRFGEKVGTKLMYFWASIFLGTWNVNGKKASDSLERWLIEDLAVMPDIYALGFQELDLSAENFFLNNSPLENEWTSHIEKTLTSKYCLVMK